MGITELTIAVWPWLLTMIGFLLVVTFSARLDVMDATIIRAW